jgi:hypothetical protein
LPEQKRLARPKARDGPRDAPQAAAESPQGARKAVASVKAVFFERRTTSFLSKTETVKPPRRRFFAPAGGVSKPADNVRLRQKAARRSTPDRPGWRRQNCFIL